ncbi:MAG: septal ring lytic transglycosylase RlpA family protein [Gloeotrichia echinulata HAB0833]
MLFFGLLWISSWMGCVLSLSGSLPPNLASKVTLTKESINLGKMLSKQPAFFVIPKQQRNVWSTTLLPTSFFRIDWGNKTSHANPELRQTPAKKAVKNSKNQLCRSQEESVAEQPKLKTSSSLSAGTLINTSSANRDLFTSKILRSLQDFFRFVNPVEPSFSSESLPVLVVHRDEQNYEIWVNNRVVANLPNEIAAKSMQQRLTHLVNSPNLNANQLRPALVDSIPALMAGNRLLFGIEKQISRHVNRNGELLAIEWINNLRAAFQVPTLTLVEGQREMYGLTPSEEKMSGLASWYGGYFHGRLTANGEIYNQNELTVAHKSLPFNTYLEVTNLKTGKAVIVRVNDRGPYIPPRSLDLSREAARCIESEIAGVVPYKAVILDSSEPKLTLKGSNLATGKLKPGRKMALAFAP